MDAYAVDVLRPDEQGVAVGFRTAAYLMAMRLAGAFAITLAAWWSWRTVLVLIAFSYLGLLVATSLAPKPEEAEEPPRSLRDAVWQPFVGFLSRPLALEILALRRSLQAVRRDGECPAAAVPCTTWATTRSIVA